MEKQIHISHYKFISILCLFACLCIFVFACISSYKNCTCNKYGEYYEDYKDYDLIEFLNDKTLFEILKQNEDKFYDSFYSYDMKARNITTMDGYFKKIEKSVSNFTSSEKQKISTCMKSANQKLKNIKYDWFDGKKASRIKCLIGCVDGNLYENGLSHTRNKDLIIIKRQNLSNSEHEITKTLMHEKIHLYQKQYPEHVNLYLSTHNFKKLKDREFKDYVRANPDLDNYIYIRDNKDVYKAMYRNDEPRSVTDVKYSPENFQSSEHPFEKMAIDISESL